MKSKKFMIAMPDELYRAVKERAQSRGVAPAYIIREAVIEKFARDGVGTFANVAWGERTDLAARRAAVLAETFGALPRRGRNRPAA